MRSCTFAILTRGHPSEQYTEAVCGLPADWETWTSDAGDVGVPAALCEVHAQRVASNLLDARIVQLADTEESA